MDFDITGPRTNIFENQSLFLAKNPYCKGTRDIYVGRTLVKTLGQTATASPSQQVWKMNWNQVGCCSKEIKFFQDMGGHIVQR